MIFERIFASINQTSEKPAFFCRDRYYTYAETRERTLAIAHAITRVETGPEHIGIITGDDFDTYCALLAAIYLQRTYVPINRKNPLLRIASIINQAAVGLVYCTDAQVLSQIRELDLPGVEILEPAMVSDGNNPQNEFIIRTYEPRRLAYILFTSGSTGKPKGVPISYGNMSAYLEKTLTDPHFHYSGADRFLQMFELSFDPSVYSIMAPLYFGATCYVVPDSGVVFHHVVNMLEDHQITVALTTSSVISFLRPYFKEINLPHLRYSMFGGEALHGSTAKEWRNCVPNAELHNWYGPTEATVICLQYWVPDSENDFVNDKISIGKPIKNIVAILIDEDGGLITEPNLKGELCLSGDQVINKYWNNEIADGNSFIFHPLTKQKFYKTGDLSFTDVHGNYHITGRKDFQVKINGYRLELAEIEHHASKHANVNQAIVIKKNDQELVLFIETGEHAVDQDELIASLKSSLPWYMIPGTIVPLKQLPYNQNMKIDRGALSASIA